LGRKSAFGINLVLKEEKIYPDGLEIPGKI
jgi:hypothetical protein